jgi:hypothetical protein
LSTPLRPGEWERFVQRHPNATLHEDRDNQTVVAVPQVVIPGGWSVGTTPIWFVVPVGYPAAQPDFFLSAPSLCLASRGVPSNSNVQPIPVVGQPGLWFSWHLAEWRPSVDTVSTYMQFILRRFHDAR